MNIPTTAERRLIVLIDRLTHENNGRPPTMAEIAVAAGLQASSRANVQRQLAGLRPDYVTWTSKSRSLQITALGRACLQATSDAPASTSRAQESLIPDTILYLLASGLTQLVSRLEDGKALQAPYNAEWQRGMNMLTLQCLLHDVSPPTDLVAVAHWCRRTLSAWPVQFQSNKHFDKFPDQPLLAEDGTPSELCRELAQDLPSSDVELELSERMMKSIRDDARKHRSQATYVAVRKYIIEHPVVTRKEMLHASFEHNMELFGRELNDMYEPVPHSVIENGKVLLCGFCGWTLSKRPDGRLRCGDDRCRTLTEDFTIGQTEREVSAGMSLLRVRRAIRRYVVAPGKYEIKATEDIRNIGVSVELWPLYDRYDLRIRFAEDEVWAVDIKDWRFPHLLARHMSSLRDEAENPPARSFYAVPDRRVQDNPNYLSFLQTATAQKDFSVVTIHSLIEAVRDRKKVLDARH